MGLLWGITALIFFSDLIIKTYLRLGFSEALPAPLIKNFLYINLTFNEGAAFGILQGKTTLLVYIGIIFILIFFAFIKKEKSGDLLFLVACGLILGGALSNLWDRIFLGGVVDYIDIRYMGRNIWPVFNLSDSCITVGAGLIFFDSFRKPKKVVNIDNG